MKQIASTFGCDLTKACPDGKNKSGTTIAIVWSVPGSGKVFEFRFFFKEY